MKQSLIFKVFLTLLLVVSLVSVMALSLRPHVTEASSWYASGGTWLNRKIISFNRAEVNTATGSVTPLSNFPVLISVTDPDLRYKADGGLVASSTGADIIFTDSDGLTALNYEIESYASTTGQLIAWVNEPSLASAATSSIYMYFNNAAASPEPTASSTGTWNSDYDGVWHLPNGSNLTANDSTSNGDTGTISGVYPVAGEIGGGGAFNGSSSSYIDIGQNIAALHRPASAVTVEAWVKPSSSPDLFGVGTLVDQEYSQPRSGPSLSYDLEINGGQYSLIIGANGSANFSNSGVSSSANTWAHVVGTYDGTDMKVYVNGVLESTTALTGAIDYSNGTFRIGGDPPTENTEAVIDEVRVSDVARSADWIATEYNDESAPISFDVFGSKEALDTTAPGVSITTPTSGATVSSTITLTADATDDIAVAGVQFQIDGSNFGSEVTATSSPNIYTLPWDTTNALNGSHTVTAIAYDTSGNSTSASLSVTASNTQNVPSAPQSLSALTNYSQINLSWLAPSSENASAITQYAVFYKSTASSTYSELATTGPSQKSLAVTSLTTGASYDFEVFAVNGIGTSTASNIVIATPITFVPTDISGLDAWLEANAGLYQDTGKTSPASQLGDPIATWADQSGNAQDAVNASTSTARASSAKNQPFISIIHFSKRRVRS